MATADATAGSSRIFISYRREDSDIWVGRLADELRKHFPAQRIFVDIASIDPGADFVTVLEQALASAAAMLVVIGPRWLSATDRQGRKRLDSPTDFVRQEVAESLRRAGVRVFPLLVNGADMPADEDLPEPLKPLIRRQAFELTVRHWANDVAQFVVALKGVPGLSDDGTTEAAEATARLRAEQEAQRREAERAAKEKAQRIAAMEEAKKRADEETRRKVAEDARRKTEEEKAARLRAEQEAQRREAEEHAAKEEAQLATANEARRRGDEETRRKAAEARRSAEEEARRRAAEEAGPRGAEPSHTQPVLRKVVGIGGIIGVTALAVFLFGRSPDAPVATVTPPASSSPAPPAPKPMLPAVSSPPVAAAPQLDIKPPPPSVAPSSTAPVIKIGHVAPLTGGIAHLGKDNENGARLAIKEINTAGGLRVGGTTHTLELIAEDDKADPKEGTLVAKKIVDSGAVAVVGHLNSGASIPASKIYSDASMTQISPSATNPKLTEQGYKTTFRVVANDKQQGAVLAYYAHDALKARTMAIVDDRTAYGAGLADVVEKVAKEKGIKVVAREFTTNTTADFNAILTKIRATKPDVIMYGGMDVTAGPMAKQMKRLGIKSVLLAGDGVCSPEFILLAGDAANGLHCSMAGEAVEKLAKGEEFNAKLKAEFGQGVQVYSPYSYDAVYVIADAMKRAGKADRAAITAAMPATNYRGLTGAIAFDEKGDIKNGAISMFKVSGDKLEYISTVR